VGIHAPAAVTVTLLYRQHCCTDCCPSRSA
jgi:hypothetical protein